MSITIACYVTEVGTLTQRSILAEVRSEAAQQVVLRDHESRVLGLERRS